MELSTRQRAQRRMTALTTERAHWMPHWLDISTHQQPRAGRFLVSAKQGAPRYNAIYDNTPLQASRTLAAGMMSGATSPARPWFRLTLGDQSILERHPRGEQQEARQ